MPSPERPGERPADPRAPGWALRILTYLSVSAVAGAWAFEVGTSRYEAECYRISLVADEGDCDLAALDGFLWAFTAVTALVVIAGGIELWLLLKRRWAI